MPDFVAQYTEPGEVKKNAVCTGPVFDGVFRERWELGVGAIHIDQVGVDGEHGGRLGEVRVQSVLQARPLGNLLGRQRVPVVHRKRLDVLRQLVGGVRASVRDRVGVVVVAVQKDDALEARRGERRAQILDERHERRDADVDEPGEPDVRIRQRIVDRRRDDGAESWARPAAPLPAE